MLSIARSSLIALLVSGILNCSAMAAAGQPVGMVIAAENAHLGEANAVIGTNVFPGDSLQTDTGGTLRVKIGSSQVYLASASSAILLDQSAKVRIKLTHGTAGFSSTSREQLEIETPIGVVRAANGKGSFGEVTIVSPQKILVSAYHGSLIVLGSGVERTINEGDAFNVELSPSANPATPGPDASQENKKPHYALSNHSSLVFTAVTLALTASGAFAARYFASESDSTPH